MLDKLVNVFAKRGAHKKRIRRVFYNLITSGDEHVSLDAFYHVIECLKPRYLNVVARRGKIVYRAPILASNHKAVMKAIRFFKKAVMTHKQDRTLEEKIAREMENYLGWEQFRNDFYEEHNSISNMNMHLKHFRSKNKY